MRSCSVSSGGSSGCDTIVQIWGMLNDAEFFGREWKGSKGYGGEVYHKTMEQSHPRQETTNAENVKSVAAITLKGASTNPDLQRYK